MKNDSSSTGSATESLSDVARLDAMRPEDIDLSDAPEAGPGEFARGIVRRGGLAVRRPKPQVTIRVDADVLEWFRSQGRGYQSTMSLVLRAYAESHGQNLLTAPGRLGRSGFATMPEPVASTLALHAWLEVERALAGLVSILRPDDPIEAARSDFFALLSPAYQGPLAALTERARPYLGADPTLMRDLERALRARNLLVHGASQEPGGQQPARPASAPSLFLNVAGRIIALQRQALRASCLNEENVAVRTEQLLAA